MTKIVLLPLAEGFEETELISVADVVKRASDFYDIKVILASLNDELLVSGAHGIKIQADCSLKEVDIDSLSAIALAGGMQGMNNLKNDERIINIIQKLYNLNKLVSAICASAIVLDKAGVINGEFSCYPGCEKGLNGTRIDEPVFVNKNIITAAGPATAMLFGLEIVRYLSNEEVYKKLYDALLIRFIKN